MITAAQARNLTQLSDTALERFLSIVGPEVEKAATAGRNELDLGTILALKSVPNSEEISFSLEQFNKPKVSAYQQRLLDKFSALGYAARLTPTGGLYVPRGRQDDDGNGPLFQQYSIIIRW